MKNRRVVLMALPVLVGLALMVGAAGHDTGSRSRSDTFITSGKDINDLTRERMDAIVQYLEAGEHLQPDTTSDNWKKLSDDLGIMVFKDRQGVTRGTLFLKKEDLWVPLALEGLTELGPPVIPVQR